MKKLTLAIAALGLLYGPAFATHHRGHDTSPPPHETHAVTSQVDHTRKMHVGNGHVAHKADPSHTDMHDKKWEVSVGVGGSYSFAKDTYDARISDMGLAGGVQMLWNANKHLALGFDYTMMAPQSHSNNRGGNYNYSKLRAHHMGLAGKFTFANWHKMSFYSPMGIGMSNLRLKGSGTRDGVTTSENKDKWGMNFYIGAAMQYDLTDDLFIGLEYRYYMPFIQTDDLNKYGKDRYMDFHTAFLRMGMRF